MYAIINTIDPFDVAVGTTIKFTWNGNQIFKVRCQVKVNSSGELKYDKTVETMRKEFTIPANSGLTNGEYYVAVITVFDESGNESDEQSIATPFYCFTTPTFTLSVTDGDVIKTSEQSIQLSYSQLENEELNSYNITLYSYQKVSLQTTGTVYDVTDMDTIFTGLNDATEYYVRATGVTVHGMTLDTGYIHILVAYKKRYLMSVIEGNNLSNIGGIEVRSNIVSIEGIADKIITYIDGGGVDLRDNAVTFKENFILNDNFTQIFVIKHPNLNDSIIHFENSDGSYQVDVYYREGEYSSSNGLLVSYFELQAVYAGQTQISASEYCSIPSDNQYFVLYILRNNCYYDLHLSVVSEEDLA